MQPAWLGEPLLLSASWREPSGSMTRNPADRTVRATNRPELLQQIREASRRYGAKTQLALALGYTRGTIHEKLKREQRLHRRLRPTVDLADARCQAGGGLRGLVPPRRQPLPLLLACRPEARRLGKECVRT